MLKIENLYAGYENGNDILKGIDLTIDDNEVVAIVGQNGAGKSTLAKSVIKLVPYLSGSFSFNDVKLQDKSTKEIIELDIGFFFQGGRIFHHLSIDENLLFSGQLMKRHEFYERLSHIKSCFDLFYQNKYTRSNLKASYLSGGEQHQLALAMVLLKKPKLIILDEPSAGLSPTNVESLYKSFEQIRKADNFCTVLIEQNMDFAVRFSDRVVLLKEGRIAKEKRSKDLNNFHKINKFYFND